MKNKKKRSENRQFLNNIIKFIKEILINEYKSIIKRFRFSIAFKINFAYFWLFFSILLMFNFIVSIGAIIYIGKENYSNNEQAYNLISTYFLEEKEIPKSKLDAFKDFSRCSIVIYDMDKTILYTSDSNNQSIYSDNTEEKGVYPILDDLILVKNNIVNNTSTRFLNFDLVFYNSITWNGQDVVIQLSRNLQSDYANILDLGKWFILIDILLLLSVIRRGRKSNKKILKPIEEMTETVKNISVNALDTRLNVSGAKDELKDLAVTFNDMLDRIQKSYEAQHQFVSDASHELRTPIAVIQGYANMLDRWGKNDENVLDESIEAIKSETDDMKRLVENLLFLARGDNKTQRVEMKEFCLKSLIDEVYKETLMIVSSHTVSCNINEDVKIVGDRKLLKEALRIFMDNAIKYTPSGGIITIGSIRIEGYVEISISDSGIGISNEDLPNIFNRFYRADKSRTKDTGGTGLGLSIAKWIIMTHKGTIRVESREGFGTKIIILLMPL